MLNIEVSSQSNITYNAAYKAALVLTDGFRNDFLIGEYLPAHLRCTGLPADLPPSLLLKNKTFRKLVEAKAREIYLAVLKDAHLVLYLLSANGKPVACGLFALPRYYPVPRPPRWLVLFALLTRVWFFILHLITFRTASDPLHPPNMVEELQRGSKACGACLSPDYLVQLQGRGDLTNAVIPLEYAYVLKSFAVVESEQGHGYGKKALSMFVNKLTSEHAVIRPPNLPNSPAKLEFFASPAGVPFYKKCGFHVGAEWPSLQPSGALLTHTFFYLNLT